MKKGIYFLPSMFTLGNLAMGFLSIHQTMQGNFSRSAWYILFAGLFDLLDGRVARMTNTMSHFGAELDSLADMVSFGVAPALLIYNFILFRNANWGLAICLLYTIAVALRLARFNTLNDADEPQYYFKGLPSPAGAGILTTFVLLSNVIDTNYHKTIPFLNNYFFVILKLWHIIVILVAYAMISNISYFTLKNLNLSKPKTMRFMILVVVGFMLIWRFPENMLFIIFLLYFLSGIFNVLKKFNLVERIRNHRKNRGY